MHSFCPSFIQHYIAIENDIYNRIIKVLSIGSVRNRRGAIICPNDYRVHRRIWASTGKKKKKSLWWRHQMKTFSPLLAICAGNSPVTGEFPTQRPVTRSFDVFFDLRLNKRVNKQSYGWWFETLSCPLWHHCNGTFTSQWMPGACINMNSTSESVWHFAQNTTIRVAWDINIFYQI